MTEFKTIVCNYAVARPATSKGAKAYLIGGWSDGAWERLRVLARSRSGRWIEIWEDYRHLTNFRLTMVVPESPDYQRLSKVSLFGPDPVYSQERMQQLCDYLNTGGWDASPHNEKRKDAAHE
jgi:hypothetical protein